MIKIFTINQLIGIYVQILMVKSFCILFSLQCSVDSSMDLVHNCAKSQLLFQVA